MASRWAGASAGGREGEEEGEVVDSGEDTSDDDYSPGSLVIDAKEDGDVSSLSSAPPTPPISRIQSTLEYDTHPIFPSTFPGGVAPHVPQPLFQYSLRPPLLEEDDDIITTLSSLTASSQPSLGHPSPFTGSQVSSGGSMLNPAQAPPISSSSSPAPSQLHGGEAFMNMSVAPVTGSGSFQASDGRFAVSFVAKIEIASEGSPPIDVICIYHYHWREVTIDILTRNNKATLIPVKNVYNKAIPGLKQNVLSARISKLGIRSLVLPEPYVSCLKRLNMGLTGSSHYITIPDFIKICNYFKHPPPDDVAQFALVTSVVPTTDVLLLFNSPATKESRKLLTRLIEESKSRASQENSTGGDGSGEGGSKHPPTGGGAGGGGEGKGGGKVGGKGGEVDESYINSGEIDARMFSLPNGSPIYVFVREGLVYIPNRELTKILPAVSRTAMENIRNTYGITVYQASKAEIAFLKYFGIVSPKAGRTLVYKMSDVAKMYQHWNLTIPDFIREICEGKIPEEKVELGTSVTGALLSPSPSSPHWTASDDSLSNSATPPIGGAGGISPSPSKARQHLYRPSDLSTISMMQNTSGSGRNTSGRGHNTLAADASHDNLDMSSRYSGYSPLVNSANLTPEHFQQPVKMLNSFQQGSVQNSPATSSGMMVNSNAAMSSPWNRSHMTSMANQMEGMAAFSQQMMSPYGMRLEKFGQEGRKRRSSSTSGPPLDDQDLEYTSLVWGDEVLSMLCPAGGAEPHLALPELIQKVYRFRSFVSAQRRSRLGVAIVPASSLQIHALRARGSLDNTPGSTKLVTLSDAVKLAVDGNLQIPGSVILMLKKYCKESIDSILNPAYLPHPPTPDGPRVVEDGNSNDSTSATTSTPSSKGGIPFVPPPHPDIINPGPTFRTAEGVMCLVKWGSDKLVIYTTHNGVHHMGLYQVYETLFRKYVTRVNFKVRMRKHDIRSVRAPSDVRVKLIELKALPPHCPVCGLIRVPEVERLAKSFGMTPPSVFYDVFRAGETVAPIILSSSSSKKVKKPKKADGGHKKKSSAATTEGGIVHQFMSPGGHLGGGGPISLFVQHRQHGISNMATGQTSYGIVPYLTSTRDQTSRGGQGSGVMTSPGVTMTSSAPVSTDQITLGLRNDSDSLIVSIPRNLTPYKVATPTRNLDFNPFSTENSPMLYSSSQRPIIHYGGTRSKVLQNLAKKITQKSRKFTSGLNSSYSGGKYVGGQLRNSPDDPPVSEGGREYCGNFRVCPSCNQMSPSIKKSCQNCGEFLVGRVCGTCGTLNHNRVKECAKCLSPMKNSESPKDGTVGGASDTSSSHPTSPLSPKFSAPPIRSAVLKTMFPQSSDMSTAGSPSISMNSHQQNQHQHQQQQQQQQQLMTKTMFSGNLASTRKCLECGQLNSKMAKKCMQCKSHLQGRPCHRCGRPNLNHVTECYKCGATLAPTANKWVYVGSHSGRAYKRPQDPEQELLQSRAPVSCVRCHKLRKNNHFKCGRCGDVFRCRAVILQPWQEEAESDNGLHPPAKKRKESRDNNNNDETPPIDPSMVIQFARNILSLDVSDQLSSLLSEQEEQTREKIPTVEQEWEDIEIEYQAFLMRKEDNDKTYRDTQAELDGLLQEVETYNNQLHVILVDEGQANELVKTLPEEIEKLEERIESARKLLFHHS